MASTSARRSKQPIKRQEGGHSGVDIIAKRTVEYVPPNENSDSQLPPITTGKRTVRDFATGGSGRWRSADSKRISVRAFLRGERLYPRPRQPRSGATPITIAITPVRHRRRTAFAVWPRLTTS